MKQHPAISKASQYCTNTLVQKLRQESSILINHTYTAAQTKFSNKRTGREPSIDDRTIQTARASRVGRHAHP
ncbi:unnamed protein product [Amaranthus hypochondriacus]